MNKKQIIIAGGGTLLVAGIVYTILNSARKTNRFNELMLVIEENKSSVSGDISVLRGFDAGYEKEGTDGKKIILYKAAKVESIVDALREAFKNKPLQLSGTDEEAIYTIYRNIENQKKMAQVATRYQVKYGKPLIDVITSELNKNERTQLFNIVREKPLLQYIS